MRVLAKGSEQPPVNLLYLWKVSAAVRKGHVSHGKQHAPRRRELGRHYQDELQELATTSLGKNVQFDRLASAVSASSAQPLLIAASGGAQIAARWMARLHLTTFGYPATIVTPLEAQSLDVLQGAALWLISQGGQNSDILATARWAVETSPLSTYALIGRDATPLATLVDAHGGLSCNLGMSPGADGFLTTNGLWAMLTALAHQYRHRASGESPTEGDDLPLDSILQWAQKAVDGIPRERLRSTIAVVADPWTLIGADDLQVRSTEAALAHVWVTDYRNLGHGRHFWLADRAKDTTALFLSSTDYAALDAWTRENLPKALATVHVAVPYSGMLAGLASVAFSMHLTAQLGHRHGRDPGRPGVPPFGERLYIGAYNRASASQEKPASKAQQVVANKLGISVAAVHEDTHRPWISAWHQFRQSLHRRPLRALVFDFDGTLVYSHHRRRAIPNDLAAELRRLVHHGLYLGIATGRGDSAQPVIKEALAGCDLSRIVIGYHNGACIRGITEDASDLDGPCIDNTLILAHAILSAQLGHAAHIRCRATQCTLQPKDRVSLKDLWLLAHTALRQDARTGVLTAWLSSHSIDVCAPGASKRNVISHLSTLIPEGDDGILRIGDRGSWPGNDYELLDHPCGVSVDECSLHPEHCWNLAADAEKGPAGVVTLLRRLVLEKSSGVASLDLGDGA